MSEGKRTPIAVRFHRLVGPAEANGCILWRSKLNKQGYGRISAGGKRGRELAAHRVSYELAFGPIPIGLFVLHRCDTPACVNPAHLFLGTQADNLRDMFAKGRQRVAVGESRNAKLREDEVIEIRRLASHGVSTRRIAAQFKVGKSTASAIVRREKWKHVARTITP